MATRKRKARRTPKETHEQQRVVNTLRWSRIGVFSVPNGAVIGGRNKWALVQKPKNEGMENGAPDLIVKKLCPSTGQPVAIEMKRQRDGTLSDAQKVRIHELCQEGWIVLTPKGAAQCEDQLRELGYKLIDRRTG